MPRRVNLRPLEYTGRVHINYRELAVPPACAGYRLDRFLARWFPQRTRSELARCVRDGDVRLADGTRLRASHRLKGIEVLHIFIEGIAPSGAPPPFPPVLYEDDRIVVVDKPPGMLVHPTGSHFVWAVIGLAKDRWPADKMELCHRLDKHTSGCLALTKDADASRFMKEAIREGRLRKEYQALVKGRVPWDTQTLDGPIGEDGGVIRIKMAIRATGKSARTDVTVLDRQDAMTRVHCRIHTGRTHQIRVHLSEAGFPLLGDRLYGVPPAIFLHSLDHGADTTVLEAAGAPRHALHAWKLTVPHPDGGEITAEAPWPADLTRWWADPGCLPLDRQAG